MNNKLILGGTMLLSMTLRRSNVAMWQANVVYTYGQVQLPEGCLVCPMRPPFGIMIRRKPDRARFRKSQESMVMSDACRIVSMSQF